jgi:hypothetical protein
MGNSLTPTLPLTCSLPRPHSPRATRGPNRLDAPGSLAATCGHGLRFAAPHGPTHLGASGRDAATRGPQSPPRRPPRHARPQFPHRPGSQLGPPIRLASLRPQPFRPPRRPPRHTRPQHLRHLGSRFGPPTPLATSMVIVLVPALTTTSMSVTLVATLPRGVVPIPTVVNQHDMTTRAKQELWFLAAYVATSISLIPKTYQAALADLNWRAAIEDEFLAAEQHLGSRHSSTCDQHRDWKKDL